MAKYENPIEHACDVQGQVWIAHGRMKDPGSAMISCNDGFRPVSFYIETLDEDTQSCRKEHHHAQIRKAVCTILRKDL